MEILTRNEMRQIKAGDINGEYPGYSCGGGCCHPRQLGCSYIGDACRGEDCKPCNSEVDPCPPHDN